MIIYVYEMIEIGYHIPYKSQGISTLARGAVWSISGGIGSVLSTPTVPTVETHEMLSIMVSVT